MLRPTLEDFVVEMPRGAQVIYPKDLAPICMLADIVPGVRVFESGVGSGALSMTVLRYGADVVGYELREDFANRARANVPASSVTMRCPVPGRGPRQLRGHRHRRGPFDRVLLDLPEPWQVIPHAEGVLRAGRDPRRLHAGDHPGAQAAEALGDGGSTPARSRCSTAAGTSTDSGAPRPPHGAPTPGS